MAKGAPVKAAATGPNTPATVYMDTFNSSEACSDSKKGIEKKCKPEGEQSEDDKQRNKPRKRKGLMEKIGKATHGFDELGRKATLYRRSDSGANAWLDTHCDGMWFKPSSLKNASAEFNAAVETTLNTIKSSRWGMVKSAMGELTDLAVEKAGTAATKKVAGLAIRSVAKNLVGGAAVVGTAGTLGTAVEAGMLAWTAADVLSTAAELAKLAGPGGAALLDNVKNAIDIKKKAQELLDGYKASPDKALADAMAAMGQFNPCLRERRCQLVPMKNTGAIRAASGGNGCCPGQTGHHLLPREMFNRKIKQVIPGEFVKSGPKKGTPKTKSVEDPSNCQDYTGAMHDNAPVVCVEGTTNKSGSHGIIHNRFTALMEGHINASRGVDSISNDVAIEAAVKSHNQTFKPPCEPNCLRAQLHAFYDKLCSGQMKPRGGMGTDPTVPPVEVDNQVSF